MVYFTITAFDNHSNRYMGETISSSSNELSLRYIEEFCSEVPFRKFYYTIIVDWDISENVEKIMKDIEII